MKYEIRPFRASDCDFVFSNWLRTWRESKHAGVVRNHTFFTETRSLIEDLLARGMKILVADAGDTLMGFIAYELKDERTVIHYAWVKSVYLSTPVLTHLIASTPGGKPGFFTFFNRHLDKEGWAWTPEIARRKTL